MEKKRKDEQNLTSQSESRRKSENEGDDCSRTESRRKSENEDDDRSRTGSVGKPDPESALAAADGTGSALTAAMHSGFGIPAPFTREIYLTSQAIVGMRYQGGAAELLRDLKAGSRVHFVREPDNHYDSKAIMALDEQGRKLGYIPRHENQILGALMDAGKTIYGIISHVNDGSELSGRYPPTVMNVELYLREFALPGDLDEIPRQGSEGSYAVMDLELDPKKERILSVFVLRVINGEERGVFFESMREARSESERSEPEASESEESESEGSESERSEESSAMPDERYAPGGEYEKMIRSLQAYIGYLPVVSYDISREDREALENAWGIQTGHPFSNRMIDIHTMADNHLPMIRDRSFESVVKHLGIPEQGDLPQEIRCRQTWKIYRELDHPDEEQRGREVRPAE